MTIVQDFPKKQADQQSAGNMNLVQGQESNMKLDAVTTDDKNKNTTLTIVQEFPKKDAKDNIAGNIEMVQG